MSDEPQIQATAEGKSATETTQETKAEASEQESILDRAEKLKRENTELFEKLKAENDRAERIVAQSMLGGKSPAGQPQEKPKEMSPVEYAEALQKGLVNPLA